MKTTLLSVLCFIIVSGMISASILGGENDHGSSHVQVLLEKGLKAEESGNFEGALSIWASAKTQLEHPSLGIGRNYIRVVTEQRLRGYYEIASDMYLWGLSGMDVVFQKDHLMYEVGYLIPLIEDQVRTDWQKMLDNNNTALLYEIRDWWRVRDPTPATNYNERLLEHWERIAYARDHFTYNRQSVYETDDRGITYVKYGAPERKFQEDLITAGRVSNMVMEMLSTRSPMTKGTPEAWRTASRAVENAVSRLDITSRYEIWIYERQYLGTNDNMVRIFGDEPGGGFKKIQALDDLIPAQAFTMSTRYSQPSIQTMGESNKETMTTRLTSKGGGGGTVNPALILQMMLYRETASMDPLFSKVYDRIERDILSISGSPISSYSQNLDQTNKHEAIVRENSEPIETSAYLKDFPHIPLLVHRYRLLDGQNRPVYATFVRSRPQQAFLEDLAFNQDRMIAGPDSFSDSTAVHKAFGHYELVHGMELRSPQGQLAADWVRPTLVLDGNSVETASNSVFMVPHGPGETQQVYYAELHNRHPETRPRVDTPFPGHLRGVGKRTMEQPVPLTADPDILEMGDLILGYGQDESAPAGGLVPFTVSHNGEIPEGEALNVHIEIYHLRQHAGLSDFTLKYEVLERNPGIIRWLNKYRSNTELTLNLQAESSHYTENLEIRTRELDHGTYLLQLVATDRISGQQITREVEFEVVE